MKTAGRFLLNHKRQILALLSILFLCLGCQPRESGQEPAATEAPAEYPPPGGVVQTVEVQTIVVTESPAFYQSPDAYPEPYLEPETSVTGPAAGEARGRLIVKNADLRLLVEDTPIAIDRLTQIVEDVDGYIVSSRVWYQDQLESKYQFATLTIRVPVDDFELAMRRIRAVSKLVLDESTTGADVTGEYVDLSSQLENLQATRDRIRTFLDRAKNAEEALAVNQQLSQVEAQIAQIEGRMKSLFDRAAYSTITVTLEPELPIPQAEITPTATVWNPNNTVAQASDTLVDIARDLVDLGIWILIVVLPLVIVPLLLVLLAVYIMRRRRARSEEEEEASAEDR